MTNFLFDISTKAGFNLTDNQLNQFDLYEKLLLDWNKKINLTAITDPFDIATKHFVDSIYGLNLLSNAKSLIDVGTGAGFPGIPLKIVKPELSLTLLDSLNKRLTFIKEVSSSLSLENVSFVHSRAEDGAIAGSPLRESFDVAVSRAVANLSVLTEYCLPYVKVGGVFLAYKGSEVDEELSDASNAIESLGGKLADVFRYTIPETDITHSIVAIAKIKNTPEKFPRLQGKIQKKPL